MPIILLFSPSATPLVMGCVTKRSTPVRCDLSIRATFFTGSSCDRIAQPYQRLQSGERRGVAGRSAFVTEQPEIFRAGQRRVAAGAEPVPVFLFADRVDRFRHLAHDVEPIED